jgi:hypothetical protein
VALPDDQATRLRCYRNALQNWKVRGYINFKKLAQEWLARELPNYTLPDLCQTLHGFVDQGGTIDEVVERRPEYTHYEFHYDLRVKIGNRWVYFETVLLCEDADDPDEPTILVVNIHDV